jgi:hypothetical protein
MSLSGAFQNGTLFASPPGTRSSAMDIIKRSFQERSESSELEKVLFPESLREYELVMRFSFFDPIARCDSYRSAASRENR